LARAGVRKSPQHEHTQDNYLRISIYTSPRHYESSFFGRRAGNRCVQPFFCQILSKIAIQPSGEWKKIVAVGERMHSRRLPEFFALFVCHVIMSHHFLAAAR
jgi:hypothetical protein